MIKDMILQLKNNYPAGWVDHEVTFSVKIRIFKDEKRSVQLCQQIAQTGVDFVSVHARTVNERSGDKPHFDIAAAINEYALKPASIPMVFNGAVTCLEEATQASRATGALGVMAAENLLRNPAMFVPECESNPVNVIKDFVNYVKPVTTVSGIGDKGHCLKREVYRKHLTDMITGLHLFGRRNRFLKLFNVMRDEEEMNQWLDEYIFNSDRKFEQSNSSDEENSDLDDNAK